MDRDEIPIAEVVKVENPTNEFVHKFWYDWFCSNHALDRKGRTLLGKLRMITKNTKKFDPKKSYVFFKNNCPLYGDRRLYDDFRICDIDGSGVIYTVTPRNPFGKATIYGRENNFEEPLVEGTWTDVKKFFKGENQVYFFELRCYIIISK